MEINHQHKCDLCTYKRHCDYDRVVTFLRVWYKWLFLSLSVIRHYFRETPPNVFDSLESSTSTAFLGTITYEFFSATSIATTRESARASTILTSVDSNGSQRREGLRPLQIIKYTAYLCGNKSNNKFYFNINFFL